MLRRLLRQLLAPQPAPVSRSKQPPQPLKREPSPRLSDADRGLLAENLSLIIPSVASRAEHVQATLSHLDTLQLPTRIFLSDHSVPTERQAIQDIVDRFAGRLRITLIHHDPAWHFLERLVDCAKQADTPYVLVHADDDRMLAQPLARCAEFLNAHDDHAACLGQIFFVKVSPHASAQVSPQIVNTRNEDHPATRVVAHCNAFGPTLYAMTRKTEFIQANTAALSFTTNVIFWQYLSSCWLLSLGKLNTLDDVYYFRLDNPNGWRATLVKERDHSHWPYLITADHFSAELGRFKAGLRSIIAPHMENQEALEELIDNCCLSLIRRAFGASRKLRESEVALLNRLQTPGHDEHDAFIAFAADAKSTLDKIHHTAVLAKS